ncbi:hypothetical protein CJF30_00011153 [Rutstroemia sp. NJR-2017a BBW]|nr:hypothetical protein CJF30_00011153 [Rutstroemia sp. NJR-2017a BBW]
MLVCGSRCTGTRTTRGAERR